MFPPSTLASVYVKGSLKNTDDGLSSLRNNIESTMLSGIGPIVVGEQTYSGAAITVAVGRVAGRPGRWRNPYPQAWARRWRYGCRVSNCPLGRCGWQ